MGKRFEFLKVVDFADVDMGGGLYHANCYKYLDSARVDSLRSVGMPFKSFFARGTALVVVSIESKFIAAAFFEDVLQISTEIVALGKSSVKLEQCIFRKSEDGAKLHLIHESTLTLAHVSLQQKKATALPEELIKRLS